MLDVVCKDLGITYPEVLKLRREFVHWHFYNAMERKNKEFEEKEQDKRFWVALMNPEAYKEIERQENTPVTEAETFSEDFDRHDLKQIERLAKSRLANAVKVEEAPYEGEQQTPNAFTNPVSWE